MSAAATTPGLVVAATDPIRSFLSAAAASTDLSTDLRDLALTLSLDPTVLYRSLRAIWCATSSDTRPPLRQLLRGADFVLPSPKPREKSDELRARLDRLREMQERREYAELVRDVAPRKEDNPEPFSYKDQIGFGTSYQIGFGTSYHSYGYSFCTFITAIIRFLYVLFVFVTNKSFLELLYKQPKALIGMIC